MNLTSKQWYQIVSGVISGLITGAALLATIFGPDLTPKIIAGLGIANIITSSVGIAVSGQGSLVRDVASMPGVESIAINANASQTVAKVAVDPTQNKVTATPDSAAQVSQIAKGA
jgi:hypothetical protein